MKNITKRNEEYISGEYLNNRIFYSLSGEGTCKLLEVMIPLLEVSYLAKQGILGKSCWKVLENGSEHPFMANLWEYITFEKEDFEK